MRLGDSGQAAAEYAWIAAVLLGGAAAFGWPYMKELLEAYGTYLDGMYYVVDGPLP